MLALLVHMSMHWNRNTLECNLQYMCPRYSWKRSEWRTRTLGIEVLCRVLTLGDLPKRSDQHLSVSNLTYATVMSTSTVHDESISPVVSCAVVPTSSQPSCWTTSFSASSLRFWWLVLIFCGWYQRKQLVGKQEQNIPEADSVRTSREIHTGETFV